MKDLKPNALPSVGIEVQVLDHGYKELYEKSGKKADWFTTNGDVFPVGQSKMTPFPPTAPSGSRSFPRKNLSKGVGEWNHYYERAINGEVRLWDNGEGVLSTQVLQEFYVAVTRKIPQPIASRRAREIIADLGTWTVATLEVPEILSASEISDRYRVNFWDGLILAAAQKEDAEILWSEDLNDGQNYGGVVVRNPFSR
jgi:predicted nucleic acid-binding protein